MRARLDANTTPYMTHARASALFAGDDLELPVRVRGMKAERRDRQRHETKYAMRGQGPTNKSGKARS